MKNIESKHFDSRLTHIQLDDFISLEPIGFVVRMNEFQNIYIKLVFSEEREQFLLNISSLFYDFELLHDLILLSYVEDYSNYRFSQFFFYRNGRPLKQNHRLRTIKIIKQSPLTIELVLAGIIGTSGAVWAIIQALEKISNWQLNRKKLELEIKKLKLETDREKIEIEEKLLKKDALQIYVSLLKRFESNPIKLVDASIKVNSKKEEISENSRTSSP